MRQALLRAPHRGGNPPVADAGEPYPTVRVKPVQPLFQTVQSRLQQWHAVWQHVHAIQQCNVRGDLAPSPFRKFISLLRRAGLFALEYIYYRRP